MKKSLTNTKGYIENLARPRRNKDNCRKVSVYVMLLDTILNFGIFFQVYILLMVYSSK